MEEQNKENKYGGVYSHKLRAGKKRTYFFDVRTTRYDDYFITITESKRKFDNGGGYESHKIFLYKEDFNKFIKGLTDAVNHVKEELMPDFDFEAFDKPYEERLVDAKGNDNGHMNGNGNGHHRKDEKAKSELSDEPYKVDDEEALDWN